jgi:vacuolar-type H+-ATPase subunit H
MTVDPTAILSEGLARLEELRVEHLSALEGVHAAKARAEATVAEAKKDTDVIVDEAKARARDIIDAAKSEAEMILDEAKSRASEVMDAAKSEAGVIVGDTKRQAAERLASVSSYAEEGVTEALLEAEGPRASYANGIAELVNTGWATTASLAAMGHETPRRPRNLPRTNGASVGEDD